MKGGLLRVLRRMKRREVSVITQTRLEQRRTCTQMPLCPRAAVRTSIAMGAMEYFL